MTRNQIEYQKLKELQRSNRANETLTRWRDEQIAQLRASELRESYRHSTSTEDEVRRHNTVVEGQSLVDLGIRQQSASAQVKQAEVAERNAQTNWYNAETNRINAGTQQYVAQTGRLNAYTQQGMLQENVRTHKANEAIAQQQANTAGLRAGTERKVAASQIALNEARAEQTEVQTGYLGQQNARDWIGTITGGFRDVTSGAKNITGGIEDITRSYQNVTSGVKNITGGAKDIVSGFSMLIPLLGG